jgi:hypothetical protein
VRLHLQNAQPHVAELPSHVLDELGGRLNRLPRDAGLVDVQGDRERATLLPLQLVHPGGECVETGDDAGKRVVVGDLLEFGEAQADHIQPLRDRMEESRSTSCALTSPPAHRAWRRLHGDEAPFVRPRPASNADRCRA